MRLLLVYPESRSLQTLPPLGLASLAAYVRRELAGIEIRVADLRLPAARERFDELLSGFRPDVMGVYGMGPDADLVGAFLHRVRPRTRWLVLGGPLATSFHAHALASYPLDYLVAGEGGIPFTKLLGRLGEGREDVEGLARTARKGEPYLRHDPAADLVADLDTLPFPAWDLFDVSAYFAIYRNAMSNVLGRRRVLPVFTSRGCPFTCAYCHHIFGKKWRARSPENVLAEIRWLVDNFGVDALEIMDDSANLHRDRIVAILSGIAREHPNLRLSFPNGLRTDLLTEEVVDWLEKAGTYRISLGIEVGTRKSQRALGKIQSFSRIERVVRYLATKKGLVVGGFLMIGAPGETRKDVLATFAFARRLPLDMVSTHIVTPFPGSPLFARLSEEQQRALMEIPPHRFDYATLPFSLCELSHEDLARLLRFGYVSFYSSPRRMLSLLRKISLNDLTRGGVEMLRFISARKDRVLTAASSPCPEYPPLIRKAAKISRGVSPAGEPPSGSPSPS